MPVRLTDIPGLKPTQLNMTEITKEAARAPGEAMSAVGEEISKVSSAFRSLTPALERAVGAQQVLETRQGFRDEHGTLREKKAKEKDPAKQMKLIDQFGVTSQQRLDSPEVRPGVRARMEAERAEYADHVRITETASVLSETARAARQTVSDHIGVAFQENDMGSLQRTLETAREGGLLTDAEERDTLARFEVKQQRDGELRALHADPAGWLERNPTRPGKKETPQVKLDRQLANGLLREETTRATTEVADGILSGAITDRAQIEARTAKLRPGARDRLISSVGILLDRERHGTASYQNQTIGEISEILSDYRPDAEGADERYVRMDILLRTLPDGPAKADLQRGVDRAKQGAAFVPETAEEGALSTLDRDFNGRLQRLPKLMPSRPSRPSLAEEGKDFIFLPKMGPPGDAKPEPAVLRYEVDSEGRRIWPKGMWTLLTDGPDPEQEDDIISQRMGLRESHGEAKNELLLWSLQNKGASAKELNEQLTSIRHRQIRDEAIRRNLSAPLEELPEEWERAESSIGEALRGQDPDFDETRLQAHRQHVERIAEKLSMNISAHALDALASFDEDTGQAERLLGNGTRGQREIARAMLRYRNVNGERDAEREERRKLEQHIFLHGYARPHTEA